MNGKWGHWLGLLVGLGLLLNGEPVTAAPEMSREGHSATRTQEFERIEQPLGVRLGVTAVGVGLIGLELWWFLGSKPKSRSVRMRQDIQELEIAVDGGYQPSQIVVQAGQPVRLNFLRKDPNRCLDQVLIPDFQIARALPLNQSTVVEFTPEQPGSYPFTCGMNMFRGVIEVVGSTPALKSLKT
jgi:plastocyanin domain-containing protein